MTDAGGVEQDELESLHAQLAEFNDRVQGLRGGGSVDDSGQLLAALGELDVAYEELRVAEEELRTQRDQIAQLLEGRDAAQAGIREVLSSLPVAMLTTDGSGLVLECNAAAAALFGRSHDRLVRKPLVSLVVADDRPALRAFLSRLRAGEADGSIRLGLGAAPAQSVVVDAAPITDPAPAGDGEERIRWVLLPATGEGGPPLDAVTAAGAFAGLADLLGAGDDVADLLERGARLSAQALPEAAAVSFVLGDPRNPDDRGADSPRADQLDEAQRQAGEGPGVDAFCCHAPVSADDVADTPRWPVFGPRCRELGVGSALSVPVLAQDQCLGVLNAYADSTVVFSARSHQLGGLLADAMGAVLQHLAQRTALRRQAENLERALESRAVIDQAKGVIMARHGGSAEDAFTRLSTVSQRSNMKLRDVARVVVDEAVQRAGKKRR